MSNNIVFFFRVIEVIVTLFLDFDINKQPYRESIDSKRGRFNNKGDNNNNSRGPDIFVNKPNSKSGNIIKHK